MTSFSDPMKRRKMIMERYKNPTLKGELAVKSFKKFSTQCVDKIELFIKWEDNKIDDARHISEGCAVFIASTDFFIEKMIGLNKDEIRSLITNYEKMINGEPDFNEDTLGELVIFDNVKKHLNRLLCANMITETLKKILG